MSSRRRARDDELVVLDDVEGGNDACETEVNNARGNIFQRV